MAIESIAALASSGLSQVSGASALSGGSEVGAQDFMKMLGTGLDSADESLRAADTRLRELAAGQDVPIHDVMIAMEQARIDLSLVVEVRNRMLEGYQELMRMQL